MLKIKKIEKSHHKIHLTPREKLKIIKYYDATKNFTQVSSVFDVPLTTVRRVIKNFKKGQILERKKGSGRKAELSNRDKRHIKLTVNKDKNASLNDIKEISMVKTSVSTIGNFLKSEGFVSRFTIKKPLVTNANKQARLKWAMKYRNKKQDFWDRVIFSDESSFYVNFQSKQRYWKRRNEPDMIIPTVKFPTKINIWGGFCATGKADLALIHGDMNAIQFKEILDGYFLPFKKLTFRKKRNKGKLQMDNDPKHKSKLVKAYLKRERVTVLDWPSQSPDLNPIENLWAELERRTKKRKVSTQTELFNCISSAWNALKPEYLQELVRSMPKRIEEVIASGGGPIKY